RGGGEFCSDAHRQSYQARYDELALSRLLQAMPPAESKLDAGDSFIPAPESEEEFIPSGSEVVHSGTQEWGAAPTNSCDSGNFSSSVAVLAPVSGEPALATFLAEVPDVADSPFGPTRGLDLGLVPGTPTIPTSSVTAGVNMSDWQPTDPLELQLSLEARD